MTCTCTCIVGRVETSNLATWPVVVHSNVESSWRQPTSDNFMKLDKLCSLPLWNISIPNDADYDDDGEVHDDGGDSWAWARQCGWGVHYWAFHTPLITGHCTVSYSALLNMHNLNFHTLFVYGSCSWHCIAITILMNNLYWTEQVVLLCNAFSHQIH